MAKKELNSQVVIINEWHHQCIMSICSTVMLLLPTAALHEILRESLKQILNVTNMHLVEYNKRTTLNDYLQTSNGSDNSFSTNFAFANFRCGNGHLPG